MSGQAETPRGAEKEDIRILTFKRWNLPQTSSIAGLAEKDVRCGDYVSFQNYHFIDISKVDGSSKGDRLARAYQTVQGIRRKHHEQRQRDREEKGTGETATNEPDIYVQQCMVLMGTSAAFWEEKPQQLLITMMQAADVSLNLRELEENITRTFRNHGVPDEKWALYYSLDFCDLVIFAAGISFETYHDILWDISPIHTNDTSYVRDTVTTFAIEYTYLKKELAAAREREKIPLEEGEEEEKFSVSVSLNVQAVPVWNALCKALEPLQAKIFRTFGRFDVYILAEAVTFSQLLGVICAVDRACSGKTNEVFGGYEIAVLNSWEPGLPLDGDTAKVDFGLFCAAEGALNYLYRQYSDALRNINERNWGYAAELKRSILALLKNGFADEFAISVFLSFAEYLRFVTENAERIKNSLANGDSGNLFYIFQRKYFQALNMLTHCTMHGEKQFIQAPSFNATLCDIPPKLLACYASAANLITDLLNDEEDKTFSFQIVPDFQPEIYVKQISFVNNCTSKISIIYLSERLFYNPADVIPVMCHEIAHYVGNEPRKREERTKLIFSSIGVCLLYNAVPFTEGDNDLVDALGEAFGEDLLEYYREVCELQKDREPYFLDDVRRFIEEYKNLLAVIEVPSFVTRLQESWQKVMAAQDLRGLLEKMDYALDSPYLSGLYADQRSEPAVREILARKIVFDLQKMIREWSCNSGASEYIKYKDYCLSVVSAFREAYSDLRMVQLLWIKSDKKYEDILRRNSEYRLKGRMDFQSYLRHDAVCEASEMGRAEEQLSKWLKDKDSTMSLVTGLAKKYLVRYLRACREAEYGSGDVKDLLEKLDTPFPRELFETVRELIFDYRMKLCQYCRGITSDIEDG